MNTVIMLLLLCAIPVLEGACADEGAVKRVILAIYDSSEDFNVGDDYNFIHNNAEVILNHLGMKVRYHDLAKGLPPEDPGDDVYGILTWFIDDSVPQAAEYCRWLAGQIERGKKYIALGGIGAYVDSRTGGEVPLRTVNTVFNGMGLEYIGNWTDNPFVIEAVRMEPDMMGFERSLDDEIGMYEMIITLKEGCEVFLELERTDLPDSASAVVVVTPQGGYVSPGYASYIEYNEHQMRWYIDPFLFFSKALGIERLPRYDTTTLFGRRIFYSHIDGDGVRNISEIGEDRYSGEIIYEEILKQYELPITASIITVDIDPAYDGSERLVGLARDMFELDNVEIGVHGFSHPLDWERQLTAAVVRGYSRKSYMAQDDDIASESHYGDAALVTVDRETYLHKEIVEATAYTDNNLAPQGKKAELNQWTGNCLPPAEAIILADGEGLENINGGDTRFDRSLPSYTGIAPLVRQVKGQVQTYTSNANENIYTNGWSGPFDGFIYVIDTFKETEYPTLVKAPPRRITPINVYYHFYSGEREDALDALKAVYDYTLTQATIPVFTSQYARVVDGFMKGEIRYRSDGGWEFGDYGDCRTIRLDGESGHPDLARSENILGYKRWNDALYVHLGPGSAALYISEDRPAQPYLEEASTVLEEYIFADDAISFTTRLFRRGEYVFRNMGARQAFMVNAEADGVQEPSVKRSIADAEGVLRVELPVRGVYHVTIRKEG